MIEKTQRHGYISIIIVSLMVIILLSIISSSYWSVILKLKPNYSYSSYPQIHFIDVGQGDAIAINNGKDTILIDSGTELYRKKFINYLDNIVLSNSNGTLDYVILTHTDEDHAGNIEYVISHYKIGKFYLPYLTDTESDITYNNILSLLVKKHIPFEISDSDGYIENNGLSLDILYPYSDRSLGMSGSNENSTVILVKNQYTSVLLASDINSTIEKSLIDRLGDYIDVDILKVAHHGSKYSTCKEFLEATSPKILTISVGENTFGHPSNEVIRRVIDYDKTHNTQLYSNIHRTDIEGNIIIDLDSSLHSLNITNIDDYIFVPYYLIVFLLEIILLSVLLYPYIFTYLKNRKFKKVNNLNKLQREKAKQ